MLAASVTVSRRWLFAAVLALLLVGSARAGDAVKEIRLPEACVAFAVNPETGSLAVVPAKEPRIILYPKLISDHDADDVRSAKVGKQPASIVFKKLGKQAYFAVLCPGDRELVVLEAASLKLVKKIPLTLNDAREVIASRNPLDPNVYYFAGGGHDCRTAAVNLERFEDQGAIGGESTADGVLSADGNLFYFRGPWSPTGFQAHQMVKQGGKVSLRRLTYEHNSTWGYLPDPFGQYVIANGCVWSPHLDKKYGTLPANPLMVGEHRIGDQPMRPSLISSVRPIVLGVTQGKLVAISVNTLKTAGSVAVTLPKSKGPFQEVEHFEMFEAPKQSRVALCFDDRVIVVDYVALKLPDEPFLAVEIDGSRDTAVGEKLVLRITPRDPAVKVSLSDGPKGMELAGKELTWTPTTDQVGTHRVIVRAAAKDIEKANELSVVVRRPSVALPFTVGQLAVDESASTALITTSAGSNDQGIGVFNMYPHVARGFGIRDKEDDGPERSSKLAVIDLKDRKVTAERQMPVGIGDVAIDAHYVYAALAESDAFAVLSRKDLKDTKRLFTNGRVSALVPVGDKLLFVATKSGQLMVLKVPDLKPALPSEVGLGIHLTAKGNSATSVPPVRVGNGWWYDGILYDSAFQKALVVVQPRDIARLTPDGVVPPAASWPGAVEKVVPIELPPGAFQRKIFDIVPELPVPALEPIWLSPWGVSVSAQGVRHGKRHVGNFAAAGDRDEAVAAVLVPDQAAVATLRTVVILAGPGGVPRLRTDVRFHDLLSAAPQVQITLQDEPAGDDEPPRGPRFAGRPADPFVARSDLLVAVVGKRLHIVPLPKLDTAKFAPPMYYAADQPIRVLEGDSVTIALPKLRGAAGELDVTLRQQMEGAELDKNGRNLELKREPIVARAAVALAKSLAQDPGEGTLDQALTAYQRTATVRFERLAGRKTKDVPVWLTLGVIAQDKDLQTAETEVGLLVEVPEPLVRAKLKTMVGGLPGGGGDAVLLKRIADLERRLDDTNRKLDQVLRALGVPDKGPLPK